MQPCTHDKQRTLDSRADLSGLNPRRWRRRECVACGERFSTVEITAADYNDLLARAVTAEAMQEIEELRARAEVLESAQERLDGLGNQLIDVLVEYGFVTRETTEDS